MLWECKVCTNHYEGSSPPDCCSSCGSPRHYFTAYHWYGIWPESSRPDTPVRVEHVERPPYTEASSTSITCYRFHAARHFEREPDDFYKNFLETRRTFLAQQRFAGAGFNSGFYFATTVGSAVAEMLFYNDIEEPSDLSNPVSVLRQLRDGGIDCVFLETVISLDRIADLTDPIVLEYFLREGPARAQFVSSDVPYSIMRAILPSDRGGSKHTDSIGSFASSNGWSAVRFPSVRALKLMWAIDRFSRMDLLNKVFPEHPKATETSVEDQLRNQAILVVFSGSLLARSVTSYRWTDAEGSQATSANPIAGCSASELESVRVAFREREGLSPHRSAELGFLTDAEIAEEYSPDELRWVPQKERL